MLILLSQVCDGAALLVSSISNIYIGIGNTQIQNIGIIQEIWRWGQPPRQSVNCFLKINIYLQ